MQKTDIEIIVLYIGIKFFGYIANCIINDQNCWFSEIVL